MATYIELSDLRGIAATDNLRKKIAVACLVKAKAIASLPTPTPAQKSWAVSALANPGQHSDTLLNFILATYTAQTVATITGATDSQVQSAVDSAVDTLLGV